MPITHAEWKPAIHLVFASAGLNSFIHTGAYITTNACVNPIINLAEYKNSILVLVANINQQAALKNTMSAMTHLAGNLWNKNEPKNVAVHRPK